MGSKKYQQAQQQADVVPSATQHGVQRIAPCALARVAIEPAFALHVSYGRLNGAAPLDHRLHRACHASTLACHIRQ